MGLRFVFLVHYFPPINSSGAKRVEAISKFLAQAGHDVTVITTTKRARDGEFTEAIPPGVRLIELSALGRSSPSTARGAVFEPMYSGAPSWTRRTKDRVMEWLGQLPDPRLPFALSVGSPWLADEARDAFSRADVVIGSCPPWPLLLAALIARVRFGVPAILDYRDQFSDCHEMPGSAFAKWLERVIDRRLAASADQVVVISEPMAEHYGKFSPRVTTIRNGYDPEVMEAARAAATPGVDGKVVIRYLGLVSPGRVPHRFFEALDWLRVEHPERFQRLQVEFFGHAALVAQAVRATYPALEPIMRYEAPVPYRTSIQRIIEADYLLFAETSSTGSLSAQGILTTKLLEYIGSGRPVLAQIAPTTLAGRLLRQCGEQHIIADSAEVFKGVLADERFYRRTPDQVSAASASLSRKAQAMEYAAVASRMVERVAGGHTRTHGI